MDTARLMKLSGMRYRNGINNVVYWTMLTGINPREFPHYIFINQRGLCVWLDKAETLYQAYNNHIERNWNTIGAKCK